VSDRRQETAARPLSDDDAEGFALSNKLLVALSNNERPNQMHAAVSTTRGDKKAHSADRKSAQGSETPPDWYE